MSANPLDLAYLAGIVDGEGTIGIARTNHKNQPHGYYRPHFQVVNTDMRIIGKVVEVVSDITGKRPTVVVSNKGGNGLKRGYRVAVHTQWEMCLLLPALIPFLVAKREQAEIALSFSKRRDGRLSPRWYQFKAQDDEAYSRCIELNRRGEAKEAAVIELKRSA